MPKISNNVQSVTIPCGASERLRFLNSIRNECAKAGIGVSLRPVEKKSQILLVGELQLGNRWRKGELREIVVYAEEVANALHVGWDIVENDHKWLKITETGQTAVAYMKETDSRPEFRREYKKILQTFDLLVFVPVVNQCQQHVEAGK